MTQQAQQTAHFYRDTTFNRDNGLIRVSNNPVENELPVDEVKKLFLDGGFHGQFSWPALCRVQDLVAADADKAVAHD